MNDLALVIEFYSDVIAPLFVFCACFACEFCAFAKAQPLTGIRLWYVALVHAIYLSM